MSNEWDAVLEEGDLPAVPSLRLISDHDIHGFMADSARGFVFHRFNFKLVIKSY